MARATRPISYALILLIVWRPADLVAQDVKGSRDHPLVSRIPGAEIHQYEQEEFGQMVLPLGEAVAKNKFADEMTAEGKVTRIGYRLPADRGVFEAYRQYREALVDGGFKILWTCARTKACGSRFSTNFDSLPGEKSIFHGEAVYQSEMHYLVARLQRPEGDVFVQVYTYPTYANRGKWARLRVLETRPMEVGLVTVDADAMLKDLERTGRVAIYGITFDHDSAAIRAESNPTLDEMGKLLDGKGALSVFIVGHTDSTGALAYNMDLSRRRAAAVVDALVARGVAQNRLSAHGVGPLSPVGTNGTEEGRDRNRRVEMVKQAAP